MYSFKYFVFKNSVGFGIVKMYMEKERSPLHCENCTDFITHVFKKTSLASLKRDLNFIIPANLAYSRYLPCSPNFFSLLWYAITSTQNNPTRNVYES